MSFGIAFCLNLLVAGAFEPFFSKQLFSFPLSLSGQKIRKFCHIFRHHLHTSSAKLCSVAEQCTGQRSDSKWFQQTRFQKLCHILPCLSPQNRSQHVGSCCIIFIKCSRLMEYRMMQKCRDPVFGIVRNLRLVTASHDQQMVQGDFFKIFGRIFRQQFRKNIDNFLING